MGLFSVFQNNEKKKNKSYIKNLLEVAIADGKLDESELNVIINIAANFDITKDEVLSIKDHNPTIEFTPPSSYSAKVRLLEDLVKIMIADKQIDENEVKICKDLALKLDIAPVIVDELIQSSVK
jgi:uncharacterized tellurite resistance protein B-like protein